MTSYSIYLHIPFCRHRCGYCDFNTYAGQEMWIPDYVKALCSEIEFKSVQSRESLRAHTVFFGGGTPSLLTVNDFERILHTLTGSFDLLPGAEISLEANPNSVTLPYLQDLQGIGFNRISLGMQSAHPNELRLLERQHSYPDTIRALTWARQAGFENISLDLIYGLPGQTLTNWQHSLDLALGLLPNRS